MYKMQSQTQIPYRESELRDKGFVSSDKNKVQNGDILPYIEPEGGNNNETLKDHCWQIHIYGEASSTSAKEIEATNLVGQKKPWPSDLMDTLG